MPSLPSSYLITLVFHNAILASLCWLTGMMVLRWNVKVNYTRKINHFALMLIPFLLAPFFPYQPNAVTITVTLVVFVCTTMIFARPIRDRFSMVRTAFASVDRPEDRPYTLPWIISQAIVAYGVLIALFWLFASTPHPELVALPVVVTGVGDGLAEPVGIRFGKHKYAVPSLVSGRQYTRSVEGSLCVWVTAVIMVLVLSANLTWPATAALLLIVPIAMTLTEAVSPHAWDAPTLYAVGGLATYGCVVLT